MILHLIYNSIAWYSGIYLNFIISLNRCTAIVFFSDYKQIWSPTKTKLAVGLCFFFGTLTQTIYKLIKLYCPFCSSALTIFDIVCGCGTALIIVIIYFISAFVSFKRLINFDRLRSKYIREIKMTLQATCLALMLILTDVAYCFPIMNHEYVALILFISAGLNPFIYLILDRRLRRCFQRLFVFRKFSIFNYQENVTLTTVMM